MEKVPLVKSIMKPFPYTVRRTDTLSAAGALMSKHNIRHLPVTEAGALVGVISDRDIKFLVGSIMADPRVEDLVEDLKVADALHGDPYVVEMNTPLHEALEVMSERHIGSALVTRQGNLAGLFTTTDVCRYFGKYLRERFSPDGDEVA